MKKIHYAKPRKINNETYDIFTDEDIMGNNIQIVFKIYEIDDLELQQSMIDFNIIKLVTIFESGMKTLAADAFESIEETNSYDFENIQIPVNTLRKIDNLDLTAGDVFASSFNFQNPFEVEKFFTTILKKNLFDLFRKFIENNSTIAQDIFTFSTKDEDPLELIKTAKTIVNNIFLNQKNTNDSLDEFLEIFNIRNKISHNPNFSSNISINHLLKMNIFNSIFLFFVGLCVMAKSIIYSEKEDIEYFKQFKIGKILNIDFLK